MKSITIKDCRGQKIIKVYKNSKGEIYSETRNDLAPMIIEVINADKTKTTISTLNKGTKQ